MTDPDKSKVYASEFRLWNWRDAGVPFQWMGSTWDVEPEVRFTGIEGVQQLCDVVTVHMNVRPITARVRKGDTKAHAERWHRVIAIPNAREFLTLTVVLHEIAHVLVDGPHESHGVEFRRKFIELLRVCGQSISADLLTICFYEEGLTL